MRVVNAIECRRAILSSTGLLLLCLTRKASLPSAQLLTAVEGLPSHLAARVQCLQVDLDAEPGFMDELRVHKVPELLVFSGGRIVERTEGEMTTEQLVGLLEWVLSRAS
ncbi:MAG: thioredoxin family protein [Myxococcota bacterium]